MSPVAGGGGVGGGGGCGGGGGSVVGVSAFGGATRVRSGRQAQGSERRCLVRLCSLPPG